MKATQEELYFLIESIDRIKMQLIGLQMFDVAAEMRDGIKILKEYEIELFIKKSLTSKDE